jgi:hypothetical protein
MVEWPTLETFICGYNGDKAAEVLTSLISVAISAGTLKLLQACYLLDVLALFPATDSPIPSLEILHIADCQKPEDTLLSFLRRCPSIRRLTLERTKITGVGVKELMTRDSGPLEYLGLIDSHNVSFDAVEWAQNRGTTIEYDFSTDWGRKSYRDNFSALC